MKVMIVATDNREHARQYALATPYFGTAVESLLQGLADFPGTEIHVVTCARQRMQSPEKIAGNIHFYSLLVPKTGWMRTGYLGCIRAVRKIAREIRPDIVHGQGTERNCAISSVLSGFPSVLTIHGNMRLIARVNRVKPFSFHWLTAHLESFTIPRAQGVVCITNYTREAVQDLARKTWVVPNAVDRTFFEVEREDTAETTLLCVGHVCYRKNQIGLMQSLDTLATGRKFKLIFVGATSGEDPYSAEFLVAVKSRPWCEYRGQADRDELKRLLARATMLILASLEDNCPMVVLEAMAAGVPVVAPDVGGVPDLIQDGENGLLCDPLQPATIADAVSRLLDAALATRLSRVAKSTTWEKYHPGKIAQRHLEIYREVLQSGS
ncbi:MAG: glycosyltransferase family 4 protein [Chthoniobacteraceae bacterium]